MFTSSDYSAPDLLQAGIDHLSAAAALLKESPRFMDSAGYLCHMGLELMLKSWLLHSSGSFRGTHRLKDHLEALAEAGEPVQLTEREQQVLHYISPFAELRHPSLKRPVEIGTENVELVGKVAESIWQQMPDDLVHAYEALPATKKAGRTLMKRSKDLPRNLELETGITASKEPRHNK